jgi:putrescine aminotransferase
LALGEQCRDIAVAQGLVMRAVGDTMIVAPPLVIERDHVDEIRDKAGRILDLTLERTRK